MKAECYVKGSIHDGAKYTRLNAQRYSTTSECQYRQPTANAIRQPITEKSIQWEKSTKANITTDAKIKLNRAGMNRDSEINSSMTMLLREMSIDNSIF